MLHSSVAAQLRQLGYNAPTCSCPACLHSEGPVFHVRPNRGLREPGAAPNPTPEPPGSIADGSDARPLLGSPLFRMPLEGAGRWPAARDTALRHSPRNRKNRCQLREGRGSSSGVTW